jgi:exosortase K
VKRAPYILCALAFAYLMKRWYSSATPEDLQFVLAPTARIVGMIWRTRFDFVAGYGYLSRSLSFGIVPACAGINFLIMAVGAFGCGILPQAKNRPLWLAGGLIGSYLLTIAANSVRIAFAIFLQQHPVNFDHAQLHRIEGSLVYLVFLFAFYALADRRAKRGAAARPCRAACPIERQVKHHA